MYPDAGGLGGGKSNGSGELERVGTSWGKVGAEECCGMGWNGGDEEREEMRGGEERKEKWEKRRKKGGKGRAVV